ncbi:hypothetical protein CLOSPI_00086 [Thomasclavelia spiroformis DSM 1552]|uniref:Uncharacterized protein n=1 Tax=Thomasclavelia spiroformis DSM 1552 TaxID=428126 RepID=B1BYT2_9FIRM|nr:hypothetical protein CLOSPI_00086 [Thomasclavelia spiroformis DSM 1552]
MIPNTKAKIIPIAIGYLTAGAIYFLIFSLSVYLYNYDLSP